MVEKVMQNWWKNGATMDPNSDLKVIKNRWKTHMFRHDFLLIFDMCFEPFWEPTSAEKASTNRQQIRPKSIKFQVLRQDHFLKDFRCIFGVFYVFLTCF